jgi:Na+/melibiose symporter-like transporter
MIPLVHSYYLSFYFHAVRATSASVSGVRVLTYGIINTIFFIISGFLMTKTGHCVPQIWTGSLILTIGSGLFYTLKQDSGASQWILYQVVAGIGMGLCTQTPAIAAPIVCFR